MHRPHQHYFPCLFLISFLLYVPIHIHIVDWEIKKPTQGGGTMKRVMNPHVVRRCRIGCARHSTSRDYFFKNPEKKF
jgi:hypothetical protein